MLYFKSTTEEDLADEINQRAYEVAQSITETITLALEEDIESEAVLFGEIPSIDMQLIIEREDFLKNLDMNFERLIEEELFELAQRSKKWMDWLEENTDQTREQFIEE